MHYKKREKNMKRIFLLIALLTTLVGLEASAQAEIKFEKETHDFGVFNEGKPVVTTFVFENIGNEPLVINQVMTSCGCTVPNYTKSPIAPGKKGEIRITYDGKGKAAGPFKKGISVRTNATKPLTRIYIKGHMMKDK
jgi:hypothetical protein